MRNFKIILFFSQIFFSTSHYTQNSSVEGVFATQRSTHPFRIIENDAISIQSMTSLGRVGRILAGTIDASNIDKETQSSNATSIDLNVAVGPTSTNNSVITTIANAPIDQKLNSNHNVSNSSSSNESNSNNKIIFQGEFD